MVTPTGLNTKSIRRALVDSDEDIGGVEHNEEGLTVALATEALITMLTSFF